MSIDTDLFGDIIVTIKDVYIWLNTTAHMQILNKPIYIVLSDFS